ncbi:MAG TPA: EAL domain-containing protein [Steroidobacteraceae bacterium]|nr:EAL domain-containing protein [Steroidobacteraceae bacterium]
MPTPDDLWKDYAAYAQLVSALLPRARGITVFETDGEVRWTSLESVEPALPQLVRNALADDSSGDGARVQVGNNEPAYLFWMHDADNAICAVFAVSWRAGETDQRTFSYVHSMLRPVLECLQRELTLQLLLERPAPADERDGDLDVLLATSGGSGGSSDEGVQHLLESVTNHMSCEFAALVVPERNLVLVAKAHGRPVDTAILARLHRPLLSLTMVRNAPVALNAPDALPGMNLPLRALCTPIRNAAGRPTGLLALFRTHKSPEFRQREQQLAELLARRAAAIIDASFDALTGLLTRDAFERRARELLVPRTDGRKPLWTGLYIDADRMHVINDNYGMHVGDKLLTKLGELIRTRLVPGALAARISGDRFAILLPTGPEDAMTFGEALRAGVEAFAATQLGGGEAGDFSASVSIGIAPVNDAGLDLAHALAVAETACKAAKDRGRNRVELYQASDLSIIRRYEDVEIAPSLRAAIVENRLRLDAQLIAPLRDTGAATHFELLLRMIDENGQEVGPGRFLSAAVRYQLMPAVDRWVVQEAVRVLKPHAALLAKRPVAFTVNVSGQSLGEEGFDDFVVDQISRSGINPRVFCFELTESAAIANLARAEKVMTRLRELGCSIALDDFGTGLSSLAYLRALPIDMLKIDGSFVKDILRDPRAESMVQAIAQLARSMKLTTVAEFVETDEIRLHVASLGVDYGQGFAIARPAPLLNTLSELPRYQEAARRQQVDTMSLGPNDETMSRIERLLENYDHSESTLYQAASIKPL